MTGRPPAELEPVEARARVGTLRWLDVFGFNDRPQVVCPDCDQESPELENVWQVIAWTLTHYRECEA